MKGHTTGVWRAHKNTSWGENHSAQFGSNPGYIITSGTKNVAAVIGCVGMSKEEIEANAKLIESAPKLYAALELAVKLLKDLGVEYNPEIFNQ